MQITIDTSLPLNDNERQVLRLLLGETSPAASEPAAGTQAPATDEKPSEATPVVSPDLLEQAVARGTELVRAKKGAVLKKALAKIGAEKITAIDNDEDLRAFLAELPE